jgi:hypothetical protein
VQAYKRTDFLEQRGALMERWSRQSTLGIDAVKTVSHLS